MGYSVEIIFGKKQVKKHLLKEPFTDYENLINRKKYEFETYLEKIYFYKGLSEGIRSNEFEIIKDLKTNSNKEIENQSEFDYWGFIGKYYPNYSHCDNVLLSDILTRKLDGEEISESDEEYIKDWDVRKELMELDKELLSKAFEAFFNIAYPTEPK